MHVTSCFTVSLVFHFPRLFSSYLLKSKMIIEASKVKFPAVTLKDEMEKVRLPHDFV